MTATERPTTPIERPAEGRPSTGHAPGLLTLLFELSLAAALPPEAIMAPPNAARPVVHRDRHAILRAHEVEVAISRPTVDVGSGRVSLGEVDQRLDGLVVRLDTFRVTEGPGAVVSIGLVTPEPAGDVEHGPTCRDLWELANQALVNHGVPCEHLVGVGDDAFLALHGGRTAQVAWLVGDRLATVSVTSLRGDKGWAIDAARSIAHPADERLARKAAEPSRLPPRSE